MNSLTSKIDFAVVFRVKNANPNGDPLNGNRPRITNDFVGEVSDVCIKRKIRNRLMEAGFPILVQSDDYKNDEHTSIKNRAEEILSKIKGQGAKEKKACESWLDVRSFGQLFAFKAESKTEKGVSFGVRGPVSIHSAFSVAPVSISAIQITKSVNAEGDGSKRGSDTMGMKYRIDDSIYVFYGSMSPQLASRTGFSDSDADTFKKVLPIIFENDASSARPDGSMEVLNVIWWDHGCKSGKTSSAKVHRSLIVGENGEIAFEHGKGPNDSDAGWVKPEVIAGA